MMIDKKVAAEILSGKADKKKILEVITGNKKITHVPSLMKGYEKKALQRYWSELLRMKDQKTFHFFGFGRGGPYNQWLVDLQYSMKKEFTSDQAEMIGRCLVILGLQYMHSRGEDTELIRQIRDDFVEKLL